MPTVAATDAACIRFCTSEMTAGGIQESLIVGHGTDDDEVDDDGEDPCRHHGCLSLEGELSS